jgi:inorganic pyrophosphatase
MSEPLVDVFVEIPKGSRNKYEYDFQLGRLRLDRRLFSATVYPGDYGFVMNTHAEDGDPLDALVLMEDPTFPGCVLTARPLGMFVMDDEKGRDVKVVCVVHQEPVYEQVNDLDQLPGVVLDEIQHFFNVYKTLEPDKRMTDLGYEGKEAALKEIEKAQRAYADREGS